MKFKFGNAVVASLSPMVIEIIFGLVAALIVIGIMAAQKIGPFASNSVPTSVPTFHRFQMHTTRPTGM
jgi:hypothetical protein